MNLWGDPRGCALCHKISVSLWLMCAAAEGLKLIGFIFWPMTEPINYFDNMYRCLHLVSEV